MVGTGEIEAAEVGTRIDFTATHAHQLIALAHHFVNALGWVDVLVLLVNVSQFHSLAHRESTRVWRFKSHNQAEQGGFTHTVRTNHTDNASRWQRESEILVKHLFAKRFRDALRFNHIVAQAWTVWNEDFKVLLFFLLVFVEKSVVGVQTRFTLGLTCLWSHAHPFQLSLKSFAALACCLFLLSHALRLLVEP